MSSAACRHVWALHAAPVWRWGVPGSVSVRIECSTAHIPQTQPAAGDHSACVRTGANCALNSSSSIHFSALDCLPARPRWHMPPWRHSGWCPAARFWRASSSCTRCAPAQRVMAEAMPVSLFVSFLSHSVCPWANCSLHPLSHLQLPPTLRHTTENARTMHTERRLR